MRLRVLGVGPTLCLSLFASDSLFAQTTGADRCNKGNRPVRTAVGASLGAWLGFVAIKIKMSDWNDGSRSAANQRLRNQATIGGALIGAAVGSSFRALSCAKQDKRSAGPPNVRQALQPITREEIDRSGINGTAYDLVFSLRRNWLNTRGIETLSDAREPGIPVYLDNARLGSVTQLRDISVVGVTGVRYYDGSQATFRWGAGHSRGAIQVLTVTTVAP